jgi:hypothetical protein
MLIGMVFRENRTEVPQNLKLELLPRTTLYISIENEITATKTYQKMNELKICYI